MIRFLRGMRGSRDEERTSRERITVARRPVTRTSRVRRGEEGGSSPPWFPGPVSNGSVVLEGTGDVAGRPAGIVLSIGVVVSVGVGEVVAVVVGVGEGVGVGVRVGVGEVVAVVVGVGEGVGVGV